MRVRFAALGGAWLFVGGARDSHMVEPTLGFLIWLMLERYRRLPVAIASDHAKREQFSVGDARDLLPVCANDLHRVVHIAVACLD
eukprot:COSAG06_NODE_88_length_24864_cov_7.159368_8_plen_85_part_00